MSNPSWGNMSVGLSYRSVALQRWFVVYCGFYLPEVSSVDSAYHNKDFSFIYSGVRFSLANISVDSGWRTFGESISWRRAFLVYSSAIEQAEGRWVLEWCHLLCL